MANDSYGGAAVGGSVQIPGKPQFMSFGGFVFAAGRRFVLGQVSGGAGRCRLAGLARYAGGTWIMVKYGARFPLGTMIINVTRFVPDRRADDFADGAPAPASQLAPAAGGRRPGRIHHVFELRMGDLSGRPPRRLWMAALYVTGSIGLGYAARVAGRAVGRANRPPPRPPASAPAAARNAATGETSVHNVPTMALAKRSPKPLTAPITP